MPVATAKPKTETKETAPRPHDELWKECEEKNNLLPKTAKWRYMPRFAVVVRPELTPRSKLDLDAVEAYRLVPQEDLPAILVQSGSHTLIDGHHRLEAWSNNDVIRVIEEDIPDEDLVDRALTENLKHGVRLRRDEYRRAVSAFLVRHKDWTDVRLADVLRVHRGTIATWKLAKGVADEPRVRSDGRTAQPLPGRRKQNHGAGMQHHEIEDEDDSESIVMRQMFGKIVVVVDTLLDLDPEELAAALDPAQLKTFDEKVFYLKEWVEQCVKATRTERVRRDENGPVASQDEADGEEEAGAEGEAEDDDWTEPVDPSMKVVDEEELPFD